MNLLNESGLIKNIGEWKNNTAPTITNTISISKIWSDIIVVLIILIQNYKINFIR